MCCKVPYIQEFDKPPGVWCAHADPGRGCTIYGDRPGSCRAFHCSWIQDPHLGPEWKPDRAKFVLHVQPNGINLQVAVDPKFPNAWLKPPYYDRLKDWARMNAERGAFMFVRIGARVIVLLPDRDEDLGAVGLTDEIALARRFSPSGYRYDVQVTRRPRATDPATMPEFASP
jgi:hypothetical protein